MKMPPPDDAILSRRDAISEGLREIVGETYVMADAASLKAYESDALSAYRQTPMLVALPGDTQEVARILAFCRREGVKVVPRGAGTGLSGGALPLSDGITLGLGRFNRILEIDYANRAAVVQPGVANLAISEAMDAAGFYYAPDPSSQIACSIGGNVAENSGGVHCLKYGVTTNNLLGVEMVLMDGEIIRIGGKQFDSDGYDLLGLITGSEGMLGVITEVTVRILPKPPVAQALLLGFPSNDSAGRCVAQIIAAGIIPAGLELMDDPRHRGVLSCRLSARRRSHIDLRARWAGGRGRRTGAPRRRHRPVLRGKFPQSERERGGTAEILARAEIGFPRRRAPRAGLLRHGRHHSAPPAGRSAHPHFRTVGRI